MLRSLAHRWQGGWVMLGKTPAPYNPECPDAPPHHTRNPSGDHACVTIDAPSRWASITFDEKATPNPNKSDGL